MAKLDSQSTAVPYVIDLGSLAIVEHCQGGLGIDLELVHLESSR